MFSMTFQQFFNSPTDITNDLNNFNQHIQDFNNIRDEIQQINNHNLEILNNPLSIPHIINTPNIVDVSNKTMGLKGTLDSISEPLKTIQSFLDFLLHPTKIFILMWHWTLEYSYLICLIMCIIGTLLYILGRKKSGKLIPISIGFYTLIQAIGSVLK